MSKRWPQMLGEIRRVASSCSLLLVVGMAFATDWLSEAKRLEGLDDKEAVAAARLLPGSEAMSAKASPEEWRAWVWGQAVAEQSIGAPKDLATRIKRNPVYRDEQRSGANWLDEAFKRFARWLEQLLGRNRMDVNPNLPNPGSLQWFTTLVWVILGLGVAAFAYFAIRYFAKRSKSLRRARAMLEEDEPVRTLDEWLAEADELERQGKHREAVRALFLACLLRFDQHRVARFERSETNWEHLRRIQASPSRPADLDFLEPTKRFDLVWYGFRGDGPADVVRFRAWYVDIVKALEAPRAT